MGLNTELVRNADQASLERAAEIIRGGGLVAFPTETVYGLGGNALDGTAAKKIYAAKGRPSDNPLIVHLADASEAEKYAHVTPTFKKLAEAFMPGPITVILEKKPIIPDEVTGGLSSVALRVPSNPTAHRLLEVCGVPIAAPSANLSGKPSPTSFAHIETDLSGRVDMLIDGGECAIGLESTIVKEQDGVLVVLRPGAVTYEMLCDVCGEVRLDRCVTERFDGKPMAPGMKYRHYAPDAPVIILDGDDDKVYDFLSDKDDCGILCFDEDEELLSRNNSYSIGAKNDIATQAHRLFSCLREFKYVPVIYARMPDKKGIGLAVYNRLIKAAGYTVIKL